MVERGRRMVDGKERPLVACLFAASLLVGCRGPQMQTPTRSVVRGEYGVARMSLHQKLRDDPRGGEYLLDRIRVGVLTLADGYPHASSIIFQQVYEVLRQQGLNRDKALQAVVLNEDLKIWKGEPFEQALAMAYYAMTMAELGSWDNARAALDNATVFLHDLDRGRGGDESPLSADEIARRSAIYEELIAQGVDAEEAYRRSQGEGDDHPADHGYVVDETQFTLGYVLAGIANQQLDRDDEASDHFTHAMQMRPSLKPLTDALRRGDYNTILVVSWGLGPQRQGVGADASEVAYFGRFPSDDRPLLVRLGDAASQSYPLVQDINEMSSHYTWGGLAGVRRTKSAAGTGLVVGGLGATAIGADAGSDEVVIAGLAAMAAGAVMKAGAHIDPRFVDVYPQRFYIVPLTLGHEPVAIELMIDGVTSSRIILNGLAAPQGLAAAEAQLRYVRLVSEHGMTPLPPPTWAVSDAILYSNAHTGRMGGAQLPYLLGGQDVRPPTEQVVDDYWSAGFLRDMTLSDLRELYRLEGIDLSRVEDARYPGLHLLEGGDSLLAPLPGTTGFARLFGQRHAEYVPTSPAVAQIKAEIANSPARRHSEETNVPE